MLNNFLDVYLPYCLKRQEDGSYAVLNRDYKPVGFLTLDHIKYSDFPVCAMFTGLTAATTAKIANNGDSNLEKIYLYDDASNPQLSKAYMDVYLAKLAILAKLKVTKSD